MNDVCLVNPSHGLSETFIPEDLIQDPTSGIWVCEVVLHAFIRLNNRLFNECLEPLSLVSGYRSFIYQQKLFDKKIAFYQKQGMDETTAKIEAAKIVAVPGHSEHQLGLAIDVTTWSMRVLEDPLIISFGETPTGKWLLKNSYLEGFVLRYPKDKTHITHITYEPWHYRYVGIEVATVMKQKGLCLEEYIALNQG